MAINQLSTSNTFQQWLVATQVLIEASNYYQERTNLVFDTANSVFDTANAVFDTANVVLPAINIANDIYAVANIAYDTANQAFEVANIIFSNAYVIVEETSSSNAHYITFTANSSGIMREISVDTSKLYYNPSTGELNATNFNSLSDLTKKTEIQTLESALDQIMELRGVSFKWKETGQKSIGVLAQEVEKVLPEIVSTNQFGEKSVSYGNIIALLIQGIKEMKTDLENIKKRIG